MSQPREPERGAVASTPERPTEPTASAPPAAARRRPPLYRRRWFLPAVAFALVVLVVAGAGYWWYSSGRVSTDDAFIEGRIVRISAQVDGQVTQVAVADNQQVKEGDLLVQLDDRELRAQLGQLESLLRSAEVMAQNAAIDARRAEELFRRQLIARQALDAAQALARSRAAEVEALRKQVAAARLKVSYTHITAPEAGRVTRRTVEEGAYVQVGQVLMTIVPPEFWVIANFKETQLDRVRPGLPDEIKVDAYPRLRLRGHVDSVQAGTGARFSLLPPENATGNYVKVVQRVPVKILLDELPPDPYVLGPGMSVVPTIKLR
jgi:membrane fusion protein, multidrug efflux system